MVNPESSAPNEQQGNDSKFKGVRKRKWGRWVSEIRLPNSRERIWLGSYDSPEKAARAFDAAQFCLRGPSANFNFPGSLPEIHDAQSLSPQQIQIAAAKYANEHDSLRISREDDGLRAGRNLQAVAHCGNWLASSSSSSTVMSERSVNIHDGETRIDWSFMDALYTNDNGGGGYTAFPQSPLMPEQTLEENEDACMDEFFCDQPCLWNFDL